MNNEIKHLPNGDFEVIYNDFIGSSVYIFNAEYEARWIYPSGITLEPK